MHRTPEGLALTREELRELVEQMESDPFSTTPSSIAPHVVKFCKRLKGKPLFVPVEAEGGPYNECFALTLKKVECAGGKMEVGWAIWEWPTIMIEAEHHAIWVDPSGRRIDIAPKVRGEKRILFVPDPSTPYRPGRRTGSRRSPLRKDELIHEFIGATLEAQRLIGGDTVGAYRVTPELAEIELYRIGLRMRLREMTDRKLVETARLAACSPLSL